MCGDMSKEDYITDYITLTEHYTHTVALSIFHGHIMNLTYDIILNHLKY